MTVAENVALGPEAFLAARRPWSQMACSRNQRRDIATRTKEAMDRCGIDADDAPAASAISRPDSGAWSSWRGPWRRHSISSCSTSRLRAWTWSRPNASARSSPVRGRAGIGLLLVEHDMALVSAVCSYIYVLDFGNLIFPGPCAEVLSSETVRAAYLGSDSMQSAVATMKNASTPRWHLMLELRNIIRRLWDRAGPRRHDLVVPDGAVVALLGPNGAGKTDAAQGASGLLRPTLGPVLLDGEDVTGGLPMSWRARASATCPKGAGIFPTLSGGRQPAAPGPALGRPARVELAARCSPARAAAATTGRDAVRRGAADARARAPMFAEPRHRAPRRGLHGPRPPCRRRDLRLPAAPASEGISLLIVEQYVAGPSSWPTTSTSSIGDGSVSPASRLRWRTRRYSSRISGP